MASEGTIKNPLNLNNQVLSHSKTLQSAANGKRELTRAEISQMEETAMIH